MNNNEAEAELARLTIGSMVKVADLEESKWYWVIIQKRLKDPQWFQGLIDPGCITGTTTLRYGGTVFFHQNNIFHVWPHGLYEGKAWYSGLLGRGATKSLKQAPESMLQEKHFTTSDEQRARMKPMTDDLKPMSAEAFFKTPIGKKYLDGSAVEQIRAWQEKNKKS
jgi:hypothetical protein